MRHITTRARAMVIALASALLATMTPASAHAQNAVITGRVMSEFGQAIEGANVYINDLQLSSATNAQGNFTITIPSARCCGQQVNLRVRAIGYQPEMRPIRVTAGTSTFNFTMKQDVNRLDEIVVTGTIEGTERAKVPFAVGRLTVEDLPVPGLDPLRSLAGKVAGVRISQTSGLPGSSPEILFRGPTSINALDRGQGPLIIVDGAIMNVGGLEEIGALDIESVEVVKGAAGASLYGTRAANGVITIKTKRGATGTEGVKFNLRSEYGFSDLNSLNYGQPTNHHLQLDETGQRFCIQGSSNIAHCSRTIDWMTEIMRINNVNSDTVRRPQLVQWNAPAASGGELQNVFQSQIWPGRYYNSIAQVTTRNPVLLNAIDATGRVGGARFYVSGSYQREEGAIKGLEGATQRRGRVNLDYDVRQDILISVSTLYDNGYRDLRSGGSSQGTVFGQVLRGAPAGTDYLARDTLGRPIARGGGSGLRGTGNGGGTFLYDMDNDNWYDFRTTDRFLGNVTGSYFPAEWVTIEGVFAYDSRKRHDDRHVVKGYRTFDISTSLNNGQVRLRNRDEDSFNTSLTTTFRKQVRDDLNGKLSFRGLYDESSFVFDESSGQIFLVKDIFTTTNTTANKSVSSEQQTVKNVGLFAGTSLDWKDRYIFDGTFRYDGSSLFGAGNRWAPFSRVSAVWRISEEPFWNVGFLNDFRLRASRGTAGSTPNFSAQYETYNITAAGLTLGQAGNSRLKPETTTEYEVGTDFTLYNRLGVEITHAYGTTRDQILRVQTPASLGFNLQWQNAGTLQNKTWELGLNLPVLNRPDLQWSMRGTWDRTRTFITELSAPEYVHSANSNFDGSFFRITADRGTSNGWPKNRFGNIWGRKFYKACSDLPASVQSQCEGNSGVTQLAAGKHYQVNDHGWIVYVGEGNSWRDGITRNLWQTILPASQSPWNVPLYWGHPIVDRPLAGQPGEGVGITQIIGNVLPDYRFGFSNTVQYKRLSLYALLEGTMGHDIYNNGEHWGLLDFNSARFDQAESTVETAKPVGYSWRGGPSESTGIGGFYDVPVVSNYGVEDASFAKVREMSLTYKVGPVRGIGDWTVGLVGRNLMTFTNYSGFDPEIGVSGGQTGSGLLNQVDAFDFPTLRTFTFSLTTRF